MAKIQLSKAFTMDLSDIKAGMLELAEGLQKEYGMKYKWDGEESISFTHKAGKGSLRIEGNELVLSIKLSMLYSATAPVVKKRISDWAEEHIH